MVSWEMLRLALLVLHFAGLAALIGPVLVRGPSRSTVPIMLAGAATQVVTGNGLIAATMQQGGHVIEAKMLVKLALAAAALVLLVVAAVRLRRRPSEARASTRRLERSAAALGGASLVTAVIWT